jgi:hypothetical protein
VHHFAPVRHPRPALVIAAATALLAACMRVQTRPLPTPETRAATPIRGVVLRSGDPSRIEFARVDNVAWTDSTLALTGALRNNASVNAVTTRTFALSAISAVLVRELDADRTSIIIAVVGIGAAVIGTLLLSGESSAGTSASMRAR